MNKFKRVHTMFEGGDIKVTGKPETFMPQQRVRIVRPVISGDEDEEDKFEVAFTNFGHAIVDACDLHPHPDAPATNVEFITHLMTAHPNPLVQAFIPEAVAKYAEFCLQDRERYIKQAGDAPLVNPTAWLGVAQELLDEINNKYKGR